jgi:DnaJ homolog subfamily C member 28
VVRSDADGNKRAAPDWESLTERLIREAQEDGRFDDLPGMGRPLALDADVYAGDMAMANVVLRNAGAAPPWIELDKRVRELHSKVERILERAQLSSPAMAPRLRRELDTLLTEHETAIAHLEMVAPSALQHRPRIDRRTIHARLEKGLAEHDKAP